MNKRFILASASPRRSEILKNAGFDFDVIVSDADETLPENITADEAVLLLSKIKAESVSKNNPGCVVLGCDTVVSLDGKILGKPKTQQEAFEMLSVLSGKTHKVYTGVTVTDSVKTKSFLSESSVEFYTLSDKTVRSYIETEEPMDKAGAYGIQGFGSVLVKRIDGDYFSVMGLPISESARLLADFGVKGKIDL
ncbi:MAG: Maf family protein [Acutalibacteraceae bacterium]